MPKRHLQRSVHGMNTPSNVKLRLCNTKSDEFPPLFVSHLERELGFGFLARKGCQSKSDLLIQMYYDVSLGLLSANNKTP